MSDHFPDYYQNKLWFNNVCPDQNLLTHTPFAFDGYNYSTNPSVINGHVADRHCQQTNNLHTGIWGRDNAKTYFRLHGGIGDGRGGIACRNTYENIVGRPVQLFDALNMVDFQVNVPKKSPVAPMEAMGGTGVFLPIYPKKKNCDTKGNRVGRGRMKGKDIAGRGRMKGKDITDKPFMSSDAMIVKEDEPKDIDDIPIELLLPSEWTY